MKPYKPGVRVKMNSLGVETFPRRKGVRGTVMRSNGSDELVKVKWDGLATPEKLAREFLTRSSSPLFST